MLVRLARWVITRKRAVLAATIVFVLAAGAFGGNVAKHLSSGGFDDPHSENSQVKRLIDEQFPQGATPNVVLLVTARNGNVDDPAVAAAGQRLTADLAGQPSVHGLAFSYWSIPGALPLKSNKGNQALVLARIAGNDDTVRKEIDRISPAFTRDDALVETRVGGFAEVFRQVGTTIEKDLRRAESIAIPITLLLLVLVFGSAIAATLPLVIGALSVIGTFLILRILASVTQVSIFSLNLTTAMGLGLAIDYSLFIVARYREELAAGWRTREAIVRTVATAGRTVLFSALTVAIALAALLVFPLSFLRSFAYAGVGVVFMAAIGAVVVLPALLAALGDRINRFSLFHRAQKTEVGQGFWHRVAHAVMRRPVVTGGTVVVILLLLGAPFLHIRFGLPDDRVLPATASSRQVQDEIRANFNSNEASALAVVATGIGDPATRAADIDRYAVGLSQLDGVARVDAVTGIYAQGQRLPVPANANANANAGRQLTARLASHDGVMIDVIPSVEAVSPAGERLVKHVRAYPSPFPVKVGGTSAQLVDSKASLFSRMPLAAALIVLVTFTVLFLMTGSVLVPAKAVLLNLLSLTATFGAMVWIFQEGHFASALHFTPTGTIDTTTPILMFCVAFGLSMDYEVFLLSRIKEEHDRTGDNVSSVAIGLERVGRLVTAAAVLLAVVFTAFATSQVTFIKLFGIGLTMAVLVDATLVRGVLVPSFMRLAGDANWWAPAPMRRIHQRFGFAEATDLDGEFDAALMPDELTLTGGRTGGRQ